MIKLKRRIRKKKNNSYIKRLKNQKRREKRKERT